MKSALPKDRWLSDWIRLGWMACITFLWIVFSTGMAMGAPGIVIQGNVPFEKDELEQALRVRRAMLEGTDLGRASAVIKLEGQGRVRVTISHKGRSVWIGETSGFTAARTVALHIVDLAAEEPAPTLKASPPPAARTSQAEARPELAPRLFIGAYPQVNFGLYYTGTYHHTLHPTLQPMLDLSLRLGASSFRGYAQAGYFRISDLATPYFSNDPMYFEITEIPVRLGCAYHRSWIEFRTGMVFRPYSFSSSLGSEKGLLAGAGGAVLVHYSFTRWLMAFFVVGADIFFQKKSVESRSQTQWGDEVSTIYNTNWVVPWTGAGLAIAVGQ